MHGSCKAIIILHPSQPGDYITDTSNPALALGNYNYNYNLVITTIIFLNTGFLVSRAVFSSYLAVAAELVLQEREKPDTGRKRLQDKKQ